MRAYSLDLRQRVLDAARSGTLTQAQVAERFSVSLSFVEKLLRHYRTTGTLTPRPHGGGRQRCIGPEQEAVLLALLDADNDAIDADLTARFTAATGQAVSTRTVNRTWQRLGITRKKDAPGLRTPARGRGR